MAGGKLAVERKVLRSISEFSMFKYILVFYLIFFILSAIIMTIIGLIAWFVFGINIYGILTSLGLANLNVLFNFFGGGTAVTIIVLVVGGLIASIFFAAVGTFMVWIINVVLKIIGGIELRFLPGKEAEAKVKEPEVVS
jgi:hypothetical protein